MNSVSKTQTVGQLLAKKRRAKKLSLSEIEALTFIKLKYLTAIEADQFSELPNASYVKAYVNTYAKVLATDPKPLLAILRRDYQASAKGRLVPREFIKKTISRRQFFSPVRFALLSLASLFIIFLSYVAWQWYQLSRPPAIEVFSPEENQAVAAKVLVEGQTVNDALVVVNAQAVALDEAGFFSTELYLPTEGPSTITIKATDRRGKTSVVQRNVQVDF